MLLVRWQTCPGGRPPTFEPGSVTFGFSRPRHICHLLGVKLLSSVESSGSHWWTCTFSIPVLGSAHRANEDVGPSGHPEVWLFGHIHAAMWSFCRSLVSGANSDPTGGLNSLYGPTNCLSRGSSPMLLRLCSKPSDNGTVLSSTRPHATSSDPKTEPSNRQCSQHRAIIGQSVTHVGL